jgi:predicted regulator of Ras-like GTPase activity (Roadblock/LC7/MglB family)
VRLLDEHRRSSERLSSATGWTQAPPPPNDDSLGDLEGDAFVSEEDAAFDNAFDSFVAPQAPPLVTTQPNQKQPENRMNIKESLAKLTQIDGFVGAALVDSESGMLLGAEGGGGMNLEVAAAGNTEVVRAKRKTMGNLGIKENLEDILISLTKQYHLIRPLRSRSSLFFYVALDRSRANLAMARITLADVEKELTV